jgi:hypothetical protein
VETEREVVLRRGVGRLERALDCELKPLVRPGLGRIVVLYGRASTLQRVHKDIRCPSF